MQPFEDILSAIGAKEKEIIKKSTNWDLWKVIYETPFKSIKGYYLYLKHKCTKQEILDKLNKINWNRYTGEHGYEIIITPKSPLVNHIKAINKFHSKKVRTTRDLLIDNLLKDFSSKPFETEKYFIDPDIELEDGSTKHEATDFLIKWLKNQDTSAKKSKLAVLVANAGVGKTTVSRIISDKLTKLDTITIPLLIESDQWRNLINTKLTMNDIWNKALSRRFDHAGSLLDNPTALKVLIREGIFIVIFDGFDELCVAPDSSLMPDEVIEHLKDLVFEEDETIQSKIIITSRSTFWESIKEDLDIDGIEVFKLKGFDNEQRKRYFYQRLSKPSERDLALRISKQISGKIYDDLPIENLNEKRPSGVPFILDLIARYVHDNPEAEVNVYDTDPFANLLEGICKRENRRQGFNIDPKNQFNLFEELFRENPQYFTLKDLSLYLEVLCEIKDQKIIKKFTQHAFISYIDKDLYKPQYEVLPIYFLARFLANRLKNVIDLNENERSKILELLAQQKSGQTQVMDWLVAQLKDFDEQKRIIALNHAINMVNEQNDIEKKTSSLMAIFHLINNLISKKDKLERTTLLRKYLNIKKDTNGYSFEKIVFTGLIKGFIFEDISFRNCTIINAEFKNCTFNNNTKFINCRFQGTLKFTNCSQANEIDSIDSTFSHEAEFTFDSIRKKGIRQEIKEKFAEDALYRALKKFKAGIGFTSIKYSNRLRGFKQGNPYNDKIWEALLSNKIVEKHNISNVDGGGLNIIDDHDIRNEILFFLDNGVIGVKLKKVINDII